MSDGIYTVTPRKARELIVDIMSAGLVPYVHGSPGAGKSAIMRSIADEYNLQLIDHRLSTSSPEDLTGLPRFVDGYAEFVPFKGIFPTEDVAIPKGKEGFMLFCHHEDTEVLTEKGFILFSELTKDVKVAQFDMENQEITYAAPEAYISYHKEGFLYECEGDTVKFAITEDHDLILGSYPGRTQSQKFYKRKPNEVPFSSDRIIPLAGYTPEGRGELTSEEKLAIVFQADGAFTWKHEDDVSCSISMSFTKERKISKFMEDFPEISSRVYGKSTQFFIKVPRENVSKNLRDIFNPQEFSTEGKRAWLEYVTHWDGFTQTNGKAWGYSSKIKDNVDLVQEFALQAGYRTTISKSTDDRSESFSDIYKVHWYPKDFATTQCLRSMKKVPYSGMVYCLKMPKSTLITRYRNSVLISGNCDEFNAMPRSVQAASFKLILDRMVGQHHLHPQTVITAAGNLSTDRGITNPLSTPMQSRLIHLELEVSFDEWLQDVALPHKYDSRIIAFLSQYPSKLMDFRPDHNEKTFSCPRSWQFMNQLIKDKPVLDSKAAMYAGTITSGVAMEFIQYCKIFLDLVTIDQVVTNPNSAPVPTDPSLCWATVSHLMEKVTEDNFQSVCTYIDRFDISFRILFFRSVMITHGSVLENHPSFKSSVISVSKYLYA